jgi:hypothetical protein
MVSWVGLVLMSTGCGVIDWGERSEDGSAGAAGQISRIVSIAGSSNGGSATDAVDDRRRSALASHGLLVATAISAGTNMACALLSDESVWCWGANDHGQLGDGTYVSSELPVRVLGIDNATAIITGGTWTSGGMGAANSAFGCAILEDQSVKCWGPYPGRGGDDLYDGLPPSTIPEVNGALALAGGNWHACGLVAGGVVRCWGDDSLGEWGNGFLAPCRSWSCPSDTADPTQPVNADVSDAIAVAGQGSLGSCAVLSSGAVTCWGGFSFATSEAHPEPFLIPDLTTTATGLAVGYSHACVVSTLGDVQCWGASGTTPIVVLAA